MYFPCYETLKSEWNLKSGNWAYNMEGDMKEFSKHLVEQNDINLSNWDLIQVCQN